VTSTNTSANSRRGLLRERALSLESSIPRGERLRLVTESYQQTGGQAEIIRRARAFAHYLRHLPIRIFPEERLVGLPQGRAVCHQGLSPHDTEWWVGIEYPEFRLPPNAASDERIPPELRECLRWWEETRTPRSDPLDASPRAEEIRKAQQTGMFIAGGSPIGHALPGHWWILQVGLGHVAEQARARIPEARDAEQRDTWEAMAIAAEAGIAYAERYADLARRMSAEAEDAALREELLEIAETCAWVPRKPPRSFREALQCIWLVHRLDEMEQGDAQPTTHCFGRLDQLLHSYYEQDLAAGVMTCEEARDALREFYLKLYRYYADQHIMLGGVKPDGRDGTNEISRVILEIAKEERLLIDIGARVHRDTPPWFWQLIAEVSQLNLGLCVFGDEAIIPGLVDLGLPLRWARDYAVVGCVETVIAGYMPSRTLEHNFNPAKCVELALNDGRCAMTAEQFGPNSGDPTSFGSMDEVWKAFAQQMRAGISLCVEATVLGEKRHLATVYLPFQSCTYPSGLKKGVEVTHGGATWNAAGAAMISVATAADSLAAAEAAVFDERTVSMAELVEALREDFEGREDLRQRLLRKAPKFGNGEQVADKWARKIVELYAAELRDYRNLFGEHFLPMVFGMPVGAAVRFAGRTGATPDGRRAGDPIAKGMAPATGADRAGPTAALRSVASCDHSLLCGGTTYILDLHSSAVRGERGTEQLTQLLRTFFEMGGSNLGVNVVRAETLREAKVHPEQYRSLSVRIFGYSDYFVNLDPELQDFLIERADKGDS